MSYTESMFLDKLSVARCGEGRARIHEAADDYLRGPQGWGDLKETARKHGVGYDELSKRVSVVRARWARHGASHQKLHSMYLVIPKEYV